MVKKLGCECRAGMDGVQVQFDEDESTWGCTWFVIRKLKKEIQVTEDDDAAAGGQWRRRRHRHRRRSGWPIHKCDPKT